MKKIILLSLPLCLQMAQGQEFAAVKQSGNIETTQAPTFQDDRRVARSGAVFIRDYSVPSLGEAYRTEKDVIWGEVAKDKKGNALKMSQYEAENYCKAKNARLPTKEESDDLMTSLGGTGLYRRSSSYYPYQAGTDEEIMPNLRNWFWSTPIYENARHAYMFSGKFGSFAFGGGQSHRGWTSAAVRCVLTKAEVERELALNENKSHRNSWKFALRKAMFDSQACMKDADTRPYFEFGHGTEGGKLETLLNQGLSSPANKFAASEIVQGDLSQRRRCLLDVYDKMLGKNTGCAMNMDKYCAIANDTVRDLLTDLNKRVESSRR